jgi:MFS family permease
LRSTRTASRARFRSEAARRQRRRPPLDLLKPAADRPFTGLLVVGLGASLAPLDLAVNVAFPAITAAFDLETQAIRWVIAAYVLTYASLMLAFGKLGDIVGYRRVFRAGLVVAAVAFVLCAVAPGYGWLLAARAAQGVGAALLLSCAPALVTSLYDESRRTWALGAYASLGAAAGMIAPLAGGASIAALGWSGVFWFRAPLAVVTIALLPLVPAMPLAQRPGHQTRFDLPGSALLAAGLAMLLIAPTFVQSSGSAWPALSSALAGALLLGAFAHRQGRSENPFLPGAVMRDPGFALLNLSSAAVHLTAFAIPLLVPYYLARISGHGPLQIGGLLTPWPVGMMVGSILAAPVARALGRRPTVLIGGALLAIGQFAIGSWPAGPAVMLSALFVHGAGIGLFQVAYTDIVIAALPQHDRGVAGSLTILTRTIGILVGAAALTAALQSIEAGNLAAGQSAREAFLAAFQSVFHGSALVFALFFALASVRRPA